MGPDFDSLTRGTARWLAAASAGAIALCAAAPAFAQANPAVTAAAAQPPASGGGAASTTQQATNDAAPAAAEPEIVVTGFRSSLARALNMKERENGETDTILAEDIG